MLSKRRLRLEATLTGSQRSITRTHLINSLKASQTQIAVQKKEKKAKELGTQLRRNGKSGIR